jgi:cytochrome c peroxidase
MLRHLHLAILIAIVPIAAITPAWSAAVVGPSRPAPLSPTQPPATDEIKAQYLRPDTIPFPLANPYTPEKAQLGHILYNDTRLSDTGALSCASCHNPGFGYGDGLPKAIGHDSKVSERRSPSIVNSAWGVSYMWDGRASSLEQQAIGPMVNPDEMNTTIDRLVHMLSGIGSYRLLFEAAYPNQPITAETVAGAIATYERTIVSGVAPFDAWIEGDAAAISDAAKRGFELFNTKARCASCHVGWAFTDDGFHDIGLPDGDLGRGVLLPQITSMQHAFKTPSLRETERRGPYMHDGSLPTLEAVVDRYNQGGVARPSRSPLVGPLGLSADEQHDIIAFLLTLTGSADPEFIPVLPR